LRRPEVEGDKGKRPLRVLGQRRRFPGGLLFGINLIPDGRGKIALGTRSRSFEKARGRRRRELNSDRSAETARSGGAKVA
jgi:hypothetical protein